MNSRLNPVDDFLPEELAAALLEPDYVAALLQKAFFNENNYDPEDPAWERVSPLQYREAMNKALASLLDATLNEFDRHSEELRKSLGVARP
jgi:hypothetical protein